MLRRCALTTVTLMCLALLAGTFAQAAQNPLQVIPEEALGFALVNRLAESDAKVQAVAKQLKLPIPSPLSMFKARAGIEGVLDETGTAGMMLLPGENAGSQPTVVVFLPVTDYKQFLQKMKADDTSGKIVEVQNGNQSFVIGNRGGYALVAKKDYRHALETAVGSSRRVAADMAPLRRMLAEGDVAAAVGHPGIQLL